MREGSGTLRLRIWPPAAAALCPKGASAPRSHGRMTLAPSVKMMASGAYAIKAVASRAAHSCLYSADTWEKAHPNFAALYSTAQRRQTPLKSSRCLPPLGKLLTSLA